MLVVNARCRQMTGLFRRDPDSRNRNGPCRDGSQRPERQEPFQPCPVPGPDRIRGPSFDRDHVPLPRVRPPCRASGPERKAGSGPRYCPPVAPPGPCCPLEMKEADEKCSYSFSLVSPQKTLSLESVLIWASLSRDNPAATRQFCSQGWFALMQPECLANPACVLPIQWAKDRGENCIQRRSGLASNACPRRSMLWSSILSKFRGYSAQSVHGRVIAFWPCRNSFAGLVPSRGCAVQT
jgi:hypothetical protein